MFTNLIREIRIDSEKDIERKAKHIMEDGKELTLVRFYSTETRWEQYQRGLIDLDRLKELAIQRMEKQVRKVAERKINQAYEVEEAPRLHSISVAVEYSQRSSRVLATAEIYSEGHYERLEGHAGGGGYDRESSAVASALNQSKSVLRELYQFKESRLAHGETDKGKYCERDNRDIIGYGAGYDCLPYFEGAVGCDCYWRIFEKLGFSTNCNYTARTANFYHVGRLKL